MAAAPQTDDGETIEAGHSPADILKLVRRLGDKVAGNVTRIREQGAINEKFVQGDQWTTAGAQKGTRRHQGDAFYDNEGIPRIAVNLLRNLESTWSALLVKDRQDAKAVAANDDPLATYRADLANQLIDYFIHELDTASKVHKTATYSLDHGTAGLKVLYSPSLESVTLEPVTVFDYVIDPTPDWHNAKWVMFTSHIDEEEAEALYEASVPPIQKEPKPEKWKNSAGEDMEGVPQQELWMKPCRDYPKGLFACVVGGQVVETMDYPYIFSRDGDGKDEALLPIVLMKTREVRGSPYGGTPLTDCVALQRSYNEIVSRDVKFIRNTTNTHLLLPTSMKKHADPMQDSVLYVSAADAQSGAAAQIRYTEPPARSPVIAEMRDFFERSMSKVIGINDVTSGQKTGSISGRAIENIVELDAQKNADATKSLEVMVLDMWRLILDLVRRYYTVPRKMKMMHRPSADVLLFDSADIQGVDVRLEPGSEIDRLSSVAEQAQAERIKNGLAPASSLGASQNAPGYGMSRDAAEKLVQEFLSGANVDINPGDFQLDVVAGVIEEHRAIALQQGRGQDYAVLTSLLSQVKQLAQQANTQAPPQQEGAEPTTPPQGQPQAPAPQAQA